MRTPCLCLFLLVFITAVAGPDTLPPEQARAEDGLRYYDLTAIGLEGRGWTNTVAPYDRLPEYAKGKVRAPVWSLSRQSAGLCARFVTDATQVNVNWSLTSTNLAMPHMPATGVSGVDLYVRQPDGRWRWVGNGRPSSQENVATLFNRTDKRTQEFCLYLPLYNGVSRVEIGVPAEATMARAPERAASRRRPLLFYGTSITQGGCASRPGMVHTAIVGRILDRPVINLGFSGNGRMEPEMAELFAELDPAVFILDCLPNMNGAMVSERVEPFVRRLRQARPATPILLVEDRTYADAEFNSVRAKTNRENRAALKQAFGRLQADRVGDLYYLPGEMLLGRDGEDTVDGSHPTDLGFVRQAEAFLKVLEQILR